MGKKIYAIVTIDKDLKPSFALPNPAPQIKSISKVALIANTHRTIIRTAELAKNDRWLTPKVKWRLVQENFPFGIMLNENTHIFDGSLFANKTGKCCFLMTAFPKSISEAAADMGVDKWCSIHKLQRLDTIENLLFKHYARLADKARDEKGKAIEPLSQWIVIPQDEGFRVLFLDEGLPNSAFRISNHPELREGELNRVWDLAAPNSVIIFTCNPTGDTDNSTNNDISWIEAFVRVRSDANVEYKFLSDA